MSGADKPRPERQRSVWKGGRKEDSRIPQDRPKASNADVEVHDDDGHHIKGGSTVWKPKTKMACTYRMVPVRKFLPHVVEKGVQEMVDKAFTDLAYDHDHCREVALKMSTDIMTFLKQQEFDRYRYVVKVVVVEKKGQAIKIASLPLWDQEKDNFLSVTHENRHLCAVGMVFAVYFE